MSFSSNNNINIINLLLVLIVFLGFTNFILSSLDILTYKWDVDFSESIFLLPFYNINKGNHFYNNKITSTFNLVKYPPLFYAFSYFFVIFFGIELISVRLSELVFLTIFMIIYYKLHKRINSRMSRFLSAVLFLFPFISPPSFWISVQSRNEWLAMFFSFSSLYFFIEFLKSNNRKMLNLSVLFSVLSLFTKETFISLPISLFLFSILFYRKILYSLIKMYVFYTILFLSITILFYPNFLTHMFFSRGIINPSFDVMKSIIFQNFILIVILLWIYFKRIKNNFKNSILVLLFIYSLLALGFSVLFNIREGGWIYYSVEFPFAMILLVRYLYGSLKKNEKIILNAGLLFSVLVFSLFDPRISFYIFDRYTFPPLVNLKTDMEIQNIVNRFGDKCITENPSYMVNLGIMPPESWLAYELYKNGYVDENDIYNAFFRNKDCIVYYDRFSHLPGFEKISSEFYLYKKLAWIDLAFHKRDVFILFRKSIKYG